MNDLLEKLSRYMGTKYVFAWADDLLTISRSPVYSRHIHQTIIDWSQINKIDINIKKDKSATVSILRRGKKPKNINRINNQMKN